MEAPLQQHILALTHLMFAVDMLNAICDISARSLSRVLYVFYKKVSKGCKQSSLCALCCLLDGDLRQHVGCIHFYLLKLHKCRFYVEVDGLCSWRARA